MKTFSNRSNAKRAIVNFRDRNPDLTDVELTIIPARTDGSSDVQVVKAALPPIWTDDMLSRLRHVGFAFDAPQTAADRPSIAEIADPADAARFAEVEAESRMRALAREDVEAGRVSTPAEIDAAAKGRKTPKAPKEPKAKAPKEPKAPKAAPAVNRSKKEPSQKVAEAIRLACLPEGTTSKVVTELMGWNVPAARRHFDEWGARYGYTVTVEHVGRNVVFHMAPAA
jgi:hypothetical protein